MKKLEALELDIENFQNNLGELAAQSQELIDAGHYDSQNIQQQKVRNMSRLSNLENCLKTLGRCF